MHPLSVLRLTRLRARYATLVVGLATGSAGR